MFRLTILLIFCFNCYHCYSQQSMSDGGSDYGGQDSGGGGGGSQAISIPKPQAIIHLPENVYTHKTTETIKLDHEQLSNYLSSINYIPHTIHKHAQLLAQLDPADLQKYGQSINSNQLPLISLTVPDSKNSEYNDAQMKVEEYPQAAPQQDYAPQQQGYQQQSGGQDYGGQEPQQQGYGGQQQSYSPPQAPRKPCSKNQGGYSGQQDSKEYGGGNAGSYGSNDGGNSENNGGGGYENKSPEVEYQSGPMDNNNYGGGSGGDSGNNYDSGNSYNSGSNYYSNENSGGSGGYEMSHDGGNSYENNGQQDNGGYSNQPQQQPPQDYGKSNNEGNQYGGGGNENYESSPFDYNFVQDILKHVMNQLEQLQIDPDSLNAYGRVEDSNYGGSGDDGGESYESMAGGPNGYEVLAGKRGVQLVDRPEGAQEVNYGYSISHGRYAPQQGAAQNQASNNYEPSYTSSSTTSQATSYNANEPAVVLDNKISENKHAAGPSTVTYQMPTINLELPKKQIEHIMKAITEKKGRYSQPIMLKANSFKLPPNLNLGKIKTIAFIKSSKGLKDLPYFNSQMLGNNVNSLSNYKIVGAMSKKEEVKYESNPVLSAYGYGVSMPSSKMYASSSANKKSIVLPLKGRSKRLGHPYSSLQAASSNIKSMISASLPKISKNKKASTSSTSLKASPLKAIVKN